jgi:hypothetical protein
LRTLANATTPITLRREDERTVVLHRDEGFTSRQAEQLFRDPEIVWHPGERFELPDMIVEIRDLTDRGFPSDVAFRFAVPLEDASLRWFELRDSKLVSFNLPKIGAPPVDVQAIISF